MCGTPLPTPCIDRPACKRPCRPEKPYAVPEKIGDGAESRQTDLNGIPDKPCRKWRTVVWTGQFQYNPPQNDNGECNSERNEKVDSVFLPGWLAEKDTDQETQIQPAGSDQPIGQRQSAKCQPEQIVYVSFSGNDQAEIYTQQRTSVFGEILDAMQQSILGLIEYLHPAAA